MPSFPYGEAAPFMTETTAAENIKKGHGVVIQDSDTVVIAAEDKTTEAGTATEISCWASPMVIRGIPRNTGDAAWVVGEKVYWDQANQRCSKTAGTLKLMGIVYAAAATAATTGDIYYPGPIVQT